MPHANDKKTAVILFDYGGVLAEEGFREGLKAIGHSHGLPPDEFFETARAAVYDSGYVLGTASEPEYWALVKLRTGVTAPDHELREEILSRFVLRPWMLEIVRRLRNQGYIVGILSDQTDWLDQLDQRDDFFKEFNHVFNSYHLGMGKRGARVFSYVVEELGVPASKVLFIDDHDGNLERARSQGLRAILYRDREAFVSELQSLGVAAFGTAQQGPRFDKKKDDADVE